MEGSDVVSTTGGTLGVADEAAEVASGVGTSGAVSDGSSPYPGYGGTEGAK